jgi:hypothetical protein
MNEPDTLRLNADNPWPGLASYDEESSPWFHGREEETAQLLRLVEREPLSVLYGRSGLGKTSLIRAGLFPRLRQADYLPVRLHLIFDDDAPSLLQQIGAAIADECMRHHIEAPSYDGSVSLWGYFFRQGGEFWTSDDRLIIPLLVFDQFEEVFTLGRENPVRRERCDALLAEIGDLVENRRPNSVRQRIEADTAFAETFDQHRQAPKILLSFREDYLADFDILYEYLRARTSNRLRLLPMTGDNALAAILTASPAHIDQEAGEKIIRFIDPRPEPVEQLVVEPALLSLVCNKLNERRHKCGEEKIRADWLAEEGRTSAIIEEFYETALAGCGSEIREFIEDHLVTASGHRDSVALDNALAVSGINDATLRLLADRRLLRREERSGQVRIELIHDILAPVVHADRDLRRLKHSRRTYRRRQYLIAAIVLGLLGLTSVLGWQSWRVSAANNKLTTINNQLENIIKAVKNSYPRLEPLCDDPVIPYYTRSSIINVLNDLRKATDDSGPLQLKHGLGSDIEEVDGGYLVAGVKYTFDKSNDTRIGKEYPDLLPLVLKTKSMDAKERQYWLDIMPHMTNDQVARLYEILGDERDKLDRLNINYQAEVAALNEKQFLKWIETTTMSADPLLPDQAKSDLDGIKQMVKEEKMEPEQAALLTRKIYHKLQGESTHALDAYQQLDRAHHMILQYDKKLTPAGKLDMSLALYKVAQQGQADGFVSLWDAVGNLLNASWYLLELGKPEEAERLCRKGLHQTPNYLPLETNLAHALALQGHRQQAMDIYLGNRGKMIISLSSPRTLWETMILKDFDALQAKGIHSPIFDEAREALKDATGTAEPHSQTIPKESTNDAQPKQQ